MSPIKFEIVAIAVVLAMSAGVVGGWTMNGWRLGARVERLQGAIDTQKQSIAMLKGANDRCTAGVAEVKGAVKGFVDEADKRGRDAAAAMKAAAVAAQGHLQDARDALNRPPAPAGQECETAAAEATRYAQKRKAAP